MMSRWYALHVRTGEELDVKKAIEKKVGCMALVPQRTLKERKKGFWHKVTRTVFPGYVFIKTDMEPKTYYKISRIPSLISILGKDREKFKGVEDIPEEEMQVVFRFADCSISDVYIEGEKVIVASGPLKGYEGQIVKIDKRRFRAKVNISLMGEPRLVELGINFITKSKLSGC